MRRDFIVRDKPIPPAFPANIIHCYDGMNLISTIETIKDVSWENRYYIHVYPGANVGDMMMTGMSSILIPEYVYLIFPVMPIDLFKVRMTNANFAQRFLPAMRFSDERGEYISQLINANFFASHLVGCDFTFTNLYSASFLRANLRDAIFDNADLRRANFSESDITGAKFHTANLTGAILPANANTKTSFKALVGVYSPDTTIWTDGLPIG